METIRTDFWDGTDIPESLRQNISSWAHLRKIWQVENNAVNRAQINLRLQLIELLNLSKVLNSTDFNNRKMELLAKVPAYLCEVPDIQNILKEVRNVVQKSEKPKTRIEIIREGIRKYFWV